MDVCNIGSHHEKVNEKDESRGTSALLAKLNMRESIAAKAMDRPRV
jgi:hypothetical protein